MLEKPFFSRICQMSKSTESVFSDVFIALGNTLQYGFEVLKQPVTFSIILIISILAVVNSSILLAQDPFLAGGTRPATLKSSKSYLRNSEFYIPYQLNNESDAQSPVNLYVSRDEGQIWELYQSVVPTQKTPNGERQFNIRVGADGEYWFSIRPSRIENSPNPNLGNMPDVKIVVDTVPPVLKIESQRISNDSMTIYWTLSDCNSDSSTVQFYQRYSENTDWATISINPSTTVPFDNSDGTAGATGQFTVQIPEGATQLYLKGETSDKAKNPTIVLWLIPTAGSAANLPGTERQTEVGMDGLNKGEYQSVYFPEKNENKEVGSEPESLPATSPQNLVPQPETTVAETPADTQLVTSPQPWSPLRESDKPVLPAPPVDSSDVPIVVNKPPVTLSIPMNYAKTMIVNTPQFDLDYEITSVGRSGVGSVELWAIRVDRQAVANGTSGNWFLLATDKDNVTPIPVELKEDGVYGVKLVIKNGAGLGGENPLPGESPTQWIVLDRTAPTGELTSAAVRIDSKIPQLRLRWTSYDEFPDRTAVTLFWSRDGQEPWNPIANELPAVGEFLWMLPNDVPPRIIIKIEMKDKAGNKGEFISRSVAVDAFSPQGYIRNIHTLEKE